MQSILSHGAARLRHLVKCESVVQRLVLAPLDAMGADEVTEIALGLSIRERVASEWAGCGVLAP